MNQGYPFQRLGKTEPVVAGNLSALCSNLAWLGMAGQSAAERVHLAGEASERFTPADLLEFLDPAGTEQAIVREKVQPARWLIIARNALLIALILFTWLMISWTITQYQLDLATHPADAGHSFLALWQNGFNTGNALLSFIFFVVVELSLLVISIPAAVLVYIRKLRANLVGQKARTHLEEALRQLVPLLPPQSILATSQILATQIHNTTKQMNDISKAIMESSSDFRKGVDTFRSAGTDLQQTAKYLETLTAQMQEQSLDLAQSARQIEQPIRQMAQASADLQQQIQNFGAAQQAGITNLTNLSSDLKALSSQSNALLSAAQDAPHAQQMTRAATGLQVQVDELQKTQQATAQVMQTLSARLEMSSRQTAASTAAFADRLGGLDQQLHGAVASMSDVTQRLAQTSQILQATGDRVARPVAQPVPHRLEDLRFSAYYPKRVQVESWKTLLVYSYIPAAFQAVSADAATFKLGRLRGEVQARASTQLSRGVEITIIPTCQGIQFYPEHISFTWLEDWHPANFRFYAREELLQLSRPIEITILAGPIIIASITMEILFVREQPAQRPSPSRRAPQPLSYPPPMPSPSIPLPLPGTSENERGQAEARRYDRVFASYSHKDTLVVLAYKDFSKARGDILYWDRDSLLAGKNWREALKDFIDDAEIFQLFWSRNSAKSEYVRWEWEHALSLNRGEGFIRPFSWKNNQPSLPKELAHLHFIYTPLPQLSLRRRLFYRFFS